MNKVMILKKTPNGMSLRVAYINKRFLWIYKKLGWTENTGQIL